jgi:hypothetical protein
MVQHLPADSIPSTRTIERTLGIVWRSDFDDICTNDFEAIKTEKNLLNFLDMLYISVRTRHANMGYVRTRVVNPPGSGLKRPINIGSGEASLLLMNSRSGSVL